VYVSVCVCVCTRTQYLPPTGEQTALLQWGAGWLTVHMCVSMCVHVQADILCVKCICVCKCVWVRGILCVLIIGVLYARASRLFSLEFGQKFGIANFTELYWNLNMPFGKLWRASAKFCSEGRQRAQFPEIPSTPFIIIHYTSINSW
jgi:hypothetical protein